VSLRSLRSRRYQQLGREPRFESLPNRVHDASVAVAVQPTRCGITIAWSMDADRNLLFGAIALRRGFIDSNQFGEACERWRERPSESLGDVMLGRGWIAPADHAHLDHLVEQTMSHLEGIDRAHTRTIVDPDQRSIDGPARQPRSDAGSESRYGSLQLHALGGIGQVWRAHDRHLDREVALKELLPGAAQNAKVAARFVREARLTGQLEHPGIVPVYELAFGAGSNEPFYTMRLVHGRTLTDAIAAHHARRAEGRAEPLDFVALLAAFVAVCNTIAYAHSRGVLHRDLKGDNVVLGDFGEVIVLDWGLAKLVDQPDDVVEPLELDASAADSASLTRQGEVVGTPAYMAPEQAEGRLDWIDQRTDIFGLGAIFYEILTGRPPFVGEDTMDVLIQAVRGKPQAPHEIVPDVPRVLEALCLKALARQREDRHASASVLAREVQRWQDVQRREAEEALRASEEQYRTLADFIPGVVWTSGPDGAIDFANQYWFDFTGLTMDQTRGSGWTEILHPDDAPRVADVWGAALRAGEPVQVEYRLRRASDGVYRWFLARGEPMRDRAGEVVKWFGVLIDIEDRKQTERKLERQNRFVRLLHRITVAAYEAATVEQALQAGIDQICEYTGWPVGHVYVLAEGGTKLTPTSIWHLERPSEFQSFVDVTRATPLMIGEGLPGRVVAGKAPLWIMDVTKDDNFPRARVASSIGVKGAFAFPVLTTTGIVAVMEFFTSEPTEPDELLLQGMVQVGIQLGQVFERTQLE
jgi:eukaryotic-like serine/threonine-protein kinase